MLDAISILQILSRPGAIAQDLDGSFFVFSHGESENSPSAAQTTSEAVSPSEGVFTPLFFDLSLQHRQSFSECHKFGREELLAALNLKRKLNDFRFLPKWKTADRASFDSDFFVIKSAINEGLLDKAVVMTEEQGERAPSPDERLYLLWQLLQNCSGNLFVYGHWNDNSGVLGATPELLFARKGQQIQTMALAGTLPKNKERSSELQAEQLLGDAKERLEHQFVIDDLTEKLQTFFKSSVPNRSVPNVSKAVVLVDGPKVIELPHLFHLFTAIEGTLDSGSVPTDSTDYELIRILHPSSALGLRSKNTPWGWLKNLRGHQNLGHFGAPFGLQTPDGFLCLVGIRNIEWGNGVAKIRAGCGIVALSEADREWQELRAKRESVKALLGISS
ncbi:MAG: menaquinone-specific isochorismate synthase [Pseudomonadota bacterium]|jgi:isochorismate synthase EntC